MLQFASNIREKKILDRIWSKDHNNIMFYGSLMISTPGHLYDYFVLKWIEDPPKIQKIQMTQYNFILYNYERSGLYFDEIDTLIRLFFKSFEKSK